MEDTTINYPQIGDPTYAYYATTCLNYADHRLFSVRIYYDRHQVFLPVVLRNH